MESKPDIVSEIVQWLEDNDGLKAPPDHERDRNHIQDDDDQNRDDERELSDVRSVSDEKTKMATSEKLGRYDRNLNFRNTPEY